MIEREPADPGLRRALGGRQMGMIAVGGAIGTGLFLGSGLAISLAGPGVIIAYALGAIVALALTYALAEMMVAHPEPGGFGAAGHRYLGPWAGYVLRWIYWGAQVVNIGSEVTAAGIYLRLWWPDLPLWLPIAAFSVIIMGINTASVRFFGEFEYWFAMIKVVAIVAFLVFGFVLIFFGLPGREAPEPASWIGPGIVPHGLVGVWLAVIVASVGYLGAEAVSLTAGESRNPRRDLPRAARRTTLRLALFYVLGITVIVAVTPRPGGGDAIEVSPFVKVFAAVGLPAATTVMNLVVLTAALSAMNTNLYVTARMGYSLARDGYAPAALARVTRNGSPVNSLVLSAAGLAAAVVLSLVSPRGAFATMLSIALFCGIATWILIFVTHLAFHRKGAAGGRPRSPIRLPGAPATTVVAIAFLASILVTMALSDLFRVAVIAGVPFLVLVSLSYPLVARRARGRGRGNGRGPGRPDRGRASVG